MSKKNEKKTKTETETKQWASATGQTGPAIEVGYDELNKKEKKVLEVLDPEKKGSRPLKKIQEIGDEAFTGSRDPDGKRASEVKRNSWARNCLRRLVRSEFVEHGEEKGDGTYRITEKGRKRVARALGQAPAAPKRSRTVSASRVQPADTVEAPAQTEMPLDSVAEPAQAETAPAE